MGCMISQVMMLMLDLVQIMDPKMDSGCLGPGESLDEDYDVTRPLLPKEVLGIIDQLLCHEVSLYFMNDETISLTLK